MKPIKSITIAALWILIASPGVWADTKANTPTVTMHQQLAGELDDTGWTTAVSTEGGYLLRIPTKYNDITAANRVFKRPISPTINLSLRRRSVNRHQWQP